MTDTPRRGPSGASKTLAVALALAAGVGALAAHHALAGAGGYALPFWSDDLGNGQRIYTTNHSDGPDGIQKRGKDLSFQRHRSNDSWSGYKEDSHDPLLNSDSYSYGKPFYAMGDGQVIACWRNAPENPRPGQYHPKLAKAVRLIPGAGNHLWVLQNDGVTVLYAHAKPGSIPAGLCPHGAPFLSSKNPGFSGNPDISREAKIPAGSWPTIKRGQQLGLIGATGDSSGPHLHVHMEKEQLPVTMTFTRGLSTPLVDDEATLDGPWKGLGGGAIPNGPVLLWPPRTIVPVDHRPGVLDTDFGRMFAHLANSGFQPDKITCKTKGGEVYYDSTWTPWTGDWKAYYGQTKASYAAHKKALKKLGYHESWHWICDGGDVETGVFRKS